MDEVYLLMDWSDKVYGVYSTVHNAMLGAWWVDEADGELEIRQAGDRIDSNGFRIVKMTVDFELYGNHG